MGSEPLRMMPLYEAKMLDTYDHRDADVVKSNTAAKRQNQPRYLADQEKHDTSREPLPMNWVDERLLPSGLPAWLTGFSDVTSATNERTIRAAAFPRAGVGHTYPIWFGDDRHLVLAMFNSFVVDFLARQKVAGLHLTYGYMKQIPILSIESFRDKSPWDNGSGVDRWITVRVVALSVSSQSMQVMGTELAPGVSLRRWDPEERRQLMAELDAAMFRLYGVDRDDVDYIMDTFPIVKRKDEAQFGEYRTKRLILEIYDQLAQAERTGVPYESPIDDLVFAGGESDA